MVTQVHEQRTRQDVGDAGARRDSLHDGIGHRPIRSPEKDDEITRGSPWALAPWPTLEIAKAVRDRIDRYLPGRGNREVIAAAGDDAGARLEAVMRECVIPGLRDVRDRLAGEGYDIDLGQDELTRVALRTYGFNGREIAYTVEGGVYREPVFSLTGTEPGRDGRQYARIYIGSRGARHGAPLHHCSRAAMRRDALHELRNQMLY